MFTLGDFNIDREDDPHVPRNCSAYTVATARSVEIPD